MADDQLQLYKISNEPERKEFLDRLFDYMKQRNTPIGRIPIMAKQVLDLYMLHKLVIDRGGLVEVIRKKLWQEIIRGLHLPQSITSAAYTLRTQYIKYLYPFECETMNLSNPGDLADVIDGNRRASRERTSYDQTTTFNYPLLPLHPVRMTPDIPMNEPTLFGYTPAFSFLPPPPPPAAPQYTIPAPPPAAPQYTIPAPPPAAPQYTIPAPPPAAPQYTVPSPPAPPQYTVPSPAASPQYTVPSPVASPSPPAAPQYIVPSPQVQFSPEIQMNQRETPSSPDELQQIPEEFNLQLNLMLQYLQILQNQFQADPVDQTMDFLNQLNFLGQMNIMNQMNTNNAVYEMNTSEQFSEVKNGEEIECTPEINPSADPTEEFSFNSYRDVANHSEDEEHRSDSPCRDLNSPDSTLQINEQDEGIMGTPTEDEVPSNCSTPKRKAPEEEYQSHVATPRCTKSPSKRLLVEDPRTGHFTRRSLLSRLLSEPVPVRCMEEDFEDMSSDPLVSSMCDDSLTEEESGSPISDDSGNDSTYDNNDTIPFVMFNGVEIRFLAIEDGTINIQAIVEDEIYEGWLEHCSDFDFENVFYAVDEIESNMEALDLGNSICSEHDSICSEQDSICSEHDSMCSEHDSNSSEHDSMCSEHDSICSEHDSNSSDHDNNFGSEDYSCHEQELNYSFSSLQETECPQNSPEFDHPDSELENEEDTPSQQEPERPSPPSSPASDHIGSESENEDDTRSQQEPERPSPPSSPESNHLGSECEKEDDTLSNTGSKYEEGNDSASEPENEDGFDSESENEDGYGSESEHEEDES